MNFEIIQQGGQWIVVRDGEELARLPARAQALDLVAARLRGAPRDRTASLALRFEPGRA